MSGSVKDNPYLLTLPQLISAKNKVSKVAGHFDPDRYSLKGFESVGLNPTEFREQLRRNFNITLSNAELGALVYLFDADGDGLINTIEFLNEFFKLGEQEKQKQRLKQQEIVRRIENGKKKTERLRKKKAEILTASKIDQDWTEEDKTNAIRKVAKVAFSYSSAKGGIEVSLLCSL